MSKKDAKFIAESKGSVVNMLRTLASGIETGDVKEFTISQSRDGEVTVRADSSDGKLRVIQTSSEMGGYSKTSTEHIQRQLPKARRKTVLKMAKQGFSQVLIADKTMVSQKTISNDIARLREKGKL